jgi:hypothetical protein
MKVAVCISGGIKFPEKSLDSLSKIYPNEYKKIFIHTWKITDIISYNSSSNSGHGNLSDLNILPCYNAENILIEDYNEKKSLFEKIYDNLEVNEDLSYENFYRSRNDIGIISMFYSIFKSNELKCEYEKNNNIIFDKVIRMRFDSDFLGKDLILNSNKSIQIPDEKDWGGLNDQFAIAPSKEMDYYANIFNEFKSLRFKDKLYNPEFILKEHIDKKPFQTPVERIKFQVQINATSMAEV